MAQYALDRVLSVAGTEVTENNDGKVVFLADQIVDPSLSFTSETEDIVDAMNNVVMVLENGRGATFSASNAFFNTSILAAQVGSEVSQKAEDITKYDIVKIEEAGKAKITATPTGSVNVYQLTKDGSMTTAEPITGTATDKVVEIADAEVGERYLITYTTKITPEERITSFADAKNKLLNVTAEVLLKELCNETLHYAYIVMRGKLSGEAEWSMTRDGNHAFEIRCFPEYCGDKKLVDVIIVKG